MILLVYVMNKSWLQDVLLASYVARQDNTGFEKRENRLENFSHILFWAYPAKEISMYAYGPLQYGVRHMRLRMGHLYKGRNSSRLLQEYLSARDCPIHPGL